MTTHRVAGAPASSVDVEHLPVEKVMVTAPKTLPAVRCTVAQARAAFTDHVHMLLLVDGDRLVGTLCREDLGISVDHGVDHGGVEGTGDTEAGSRLAVHAARVEGRTVERGTSLAQARERLEHLGVRRVAVVDSEQRLLGLLCLKRHRGGYCSDAGVSARAAAHG